MRAARPRNRSVDNVVSNQRQLRSGFMPGETGLVTSEKVARLCGDHLEHAYEALRLTTHGTACITCCYHRDKLDTIICNTSNSSIAQYDISRCVCTNQQSKGSRRTSCAFNSSYSHVAVYGDPMAPAIEYQLLNMGKYTYLDGGHTVEVRCCAVSEDGKFIVSGGKEGQAFLWQVSQPSNLEEQPRVERRYCLPGHSRHSIVKACCISKDGRWVATGGNDGNVLLWDLAALRQPYPTASAATADQAMPEQAPADSRSTAADGGVPSAAGSISINPSTAAPSTPAAPDAQPQPVAVLQLPKGDQVTCLDLSTDGSWLAVGTRFGKVHVRGPGCHELRQLPSRHQEGSKVRCCAVSPDAMKLISSADDARLVLWDLKSSSFAVSIHEHFKPIRGCCWSSDGRNIVTVGMDCLLCVLDVVLLSNQHRLRVAAHLDAGTATAAARSSNGQRRAALSDPQDLAPGPMAAASIETKRTASCSSPKASKVLYNPMLQRTQVAEEGKKLIACVPVPQVPLSATSSASASAGEALGNAVLCADETGRIAMLLPGHESVVSTTNVGDGFCYCHFDGSVVAAARRDGAVTVLSCSAAAGPVAAAIAGGWGGVQTAQWDPPVAVSAKLEMMISGISVNSQLGRVALVGTDKKQHQTGVMWLWEYDPSVRPAGLVEGDGGLGTASTMDAMTRLASVQSGMLSGESTPSFGSPRGMSATESDERHSQPSHNMLKPDVAATASAMIHSSNSQSGVTPAAAAIGPDGWLWHCGNPFKVLTVPDTALAVCAWAGGEFGRLVVGSAAGWLTVVNLEGAELDPQMTRCQIHGCEVTAVDFASDGSTVVSGALDGRVVVWSHTTGFKLAVLTLHSLTIRTVSFNRDTTQLAVGDASGIISSWDVVQGCLITAVQAHDGPVSCVSWTRPALSSSYTYGSKNSRSSNPCGCYIVSSGNDGNVGLLEPDHSISKLYSAAFKGLYYSCKKNNKVHKLEAALTWHLQQGALQDPSVLQLLVMLAAADGNVAVLSLLLPLFEKMGWLLHFGPVWAAAPPTLPKSESDKSLLSRRSHFPSMQQQQQQHQYQTTNSFGEEYVIHPHDRQHEGMSVIGALPSTRRNTRDSKRSNHDRNHAMGGDLAVEGIMRNTRWASSVADIRSLLAFNMPQQPSQHFSLRSAAAGGVAGQQGSRQDDSGGSGGSRSPAPGSAGDSPTRTPKTLTPTRMLSPSVSRNARQPATLDLKLDTLHEETHTAHADSLQQPLAVSAASVALWLRPAEQSGGGDGSAPSSPHVLLKAEADEEAASEATSRCTTPRFLQRQGSAGASAAGSCGGSSTPLSGPGQQQQQQCSTSPFQDAQQSGGQQDSPLRRAGSFRNVQQQQQQQQADKGVRRLIKFLSLRRAAQGRGDDDSPEGSGSSLSRPPEGGRTRSLSEGAGMGQRVQAYKAAGLVLSSTGSRPERQLPADSSAMLGSSRMTAADDSTWEDDGAGADKGALTAQGSHRRRTTLDNLLLMFPFGSSKRSIFGSNKSIEDAAGADSRKVHGEDLVKAQSGYAWDFQRADGFLGSAKRRFALSWNSWRDRRASRSQPSLAPYKSLPTPGSTYKPKGSRDDLLQTAMASQQAQCVRLVVDALLEGRFSKASVVAHMYEALQALIHDQQHKRACRRLLKHLPMIDLGEVEVDSLLTHNTKILYKCSAHGHPGNLWASATSGQQPLLDALDVLIKRASWRDSIVALIMWPALWGLRRLGAAWLWLWATQGLRNRNRVQVSARSQLVPVARAAEIRSGSKGNLLRQLVSANVDADLYGKELVRAIINVKWESFARAFLLMQGVQFIAFIIFFLAYLSVAVYGNDPSWTTSQMLAHRQGQAAVALECILMIMMFGQAADELKQVVTYGRDYFNSPWNYMDLASCCIIPILFLLHISRLNHQLFVILVALEVLLLCLRSLYFCMALEQIGALLRMVLIVIRDMRYFFAMLMFLLISFGLTFSVLMSPATTARLNIVSLVGGGQVETESDMQVFGSLEDSMTQLFTIMFGDIQFSTLKTIMSVNTVASRLAVVLACVYAVLVLIVLVNLLIAIVDETYGQVKESEADQMLRNKALIIDEIESTLTAAVISDLNTRVLLPYVHILIPQAARTDQKRRDLHTKFRKLKLFIKERLSEREQLLAPCGSGASGASDGAPFAGHASSLLHHAPAAPWSGSGQPPLTGRGSAPAAAAAGGSAVGALRSSDFLPVPSRQGGSYGAAAAAAADASSTAAVTTKIQQDIVQLSSSVSSINHQLEAVAGSSAAAVAELAAKVEGLQGDIGQIKDMLLALLAKQQ